MHGVSGSCYSETMKSKDVFRFLVNIKDLQENAVKIGILRWIWYSDKEENCSSCDKITYNSISNLFIKEIKLILILIASIFRLASYMSLRRNKMDQKMYKKVSRRWAG